MIDDARDPVAGFSASYAEARDKFLAAATARGALIERHVHPHARGAQDEALSMDVAFIGRPDAKALLLLTSGTHGVEGFCGSGCQIALLGDDAFADAARKAGVAVLLVHAVNPYGFSHLRRVNEDNVDLNRNFHDFQGPLPVNARYAELHATLLPAQWPPTAENRTAIGAFLAQKGREAYQAAVSGGQHAFPDGLFYGGTRPTWSNDIVRALLRQHAAQRAALGWIDFHTGLGPAAHGEKIYAGRNQEDDFARARRWWGPEVTSSHDGSSTSAERTGVMYLAAYQECPGIEYTGIALEFGTVPLERVFHALRADHWLHNHRHAPTAQRGAIQREMRDVFFTDTPQWKRAVVSQARADALAAIHHLGGL